MRVNTRYINPTRGTSLIRSKLAFPAEMALFLSDEDKFVFRKCCVPINGFGTVLLRTTPTGTELMRATSILPVKWATV